MRLAGLWFSSLSIKIEDLKKAHRRPCVDCAEDPHAIGVRRLVVKKGSGRRATTEVRCQDCGRLYLNQKETEAANAKKLLTTGEGTIRCL